jgi:ubiquinone/menaquinone biosynthesis C-methylase UbiE
MFSLIKQYLKLHTDLELWFRNIRLARLAFVFLIMIFIFCTKIVFFHKRFIPDFPLNLMDESPIFKIFEGLPRQGPGSNESTGKAFRSIPSLPEGAKILDIGCGVGMQTIHLAEICDNCYITAVDVYQPYLDTLMENAKSKGVADRITTVCASMDDLPFETEEFDLIWTEGSIFVMGFEKGLEYWKQFLKSGGYIALTEAAWFVDNPAEEAVQFWKESYPDIKNVAGTEKVVEDSGYEIIAKFNLPASAWWDEYYVHMEKRLDGISEQFKGNTEAEMIIGFCRKEMDIFRKYPDEYGYVFLIFQKNAK